MIKIHSASIDIQTKCETEALSTCKQLIQRSTQLSSGKFEPLQIQITLIKLGLSLTENSLSTQRQ